MKLVINPTKLLYYEQDSCSLRLGNFPETGKVVEMTNKNMLKFFNWLTKPQIYSEAVKFITCNFNLNEQDAQSSIEYLISEDIIIDVEKYKNIIRDDRYSRQNLYFYMMTGTEKPINKLANVKVLILGIGGVGSIVSEMLVRAGVETLLIVDNDKVEKSNLIRQLSYTNADIGIKKIDALENRLKKINSNVKIFKRYMFVEKYEDIEELIKSSDFIVNTLDKPERKIRRLINEVCVNNFKPVIFAGFSEHVAMIGPFVVPQKTACLKCIEQEQQDEPLNQIDIVPSYGPICGIIGNLVTDEVINYFVKYKKRNLQGKTLMFNLYNYKTTIKKWVKKDECQVCGVGHDN